MPALALQAMATAFVWHHRCKVTLQSHRCKVCMCTTCTLMEDCVSKFVLKVCARHISTMCRMHLCSVSCLQQVWVVVGGVLVRHLSQ